MVIRGKHINGNAWVVPALLSLIIGMLGWQMTEITGEIKGLRAEISVLGRDLAGRVVYFEGLQRQIDDLRQLIERRFQGVGNE